MKIEITTTHDTYDCDDCGISYAEGGTVHVDGKLVIDFPPHAYCFDCQHATAEQLLVMALRELGHTVTVDGEEYITPCEDH